MKTLTTNQRRLAAISAVAFTVIFGAGVGVMVKVGLQEIPTWTFTFFRFALASLCIFPFYLREHRRLTDFLGIFSISILASANVILFALGIPLTTAINGQLLYTGVPILTLLFVWLFRMEKMSLTKVAGVGLGILGVVIILFRPGTGSLVSPATFLGNSIIGLAVVGFSLYSILAKKLEAGLTPLSITSWFIFVTTTVTFPFAVLEWIHEPAWITRLTSIGVISVVFSGILGTSVYYLLYLYVVKFDGPLLASFVFYLQPLAALLWARLLLGESLTLNLGLAMLLVFAATWLVTRPQLPNQHPS